MKLAAGSAALAALLAMLTALGPLSTDMYLPSLPGIAMHFSASTTSVQLTLSLFLAGFAIGQVIYGPLSDRLGRKPVLIGGLALFLIATLACAAAVRLDMLVAARFIQAVGACSAIVLARAIVRDLYHGRDAARMLSMMGALMGLVPALAPVAGGLLETAFGWRASFILAAGLAGALILAVVMWLPETLSPGDRGRLSFARMLRDFSGLSRDRRFQRYACAVTLGYGGLFAFISGSSFVLQRHYGLDELQFGFAFAVCVVGYIAGTLIGMRLSRTTDIPRVLLYGTLALAVGGVAMVLAMHLHPPRVWHVLAPMTVYMLGVGLTLPQSMAGAITPFPHAAGTASSLMGFIQMTFAAATGILTARLIDITPIALAWIIAVLGVCNLAVSLVAERQGPQRRSS